MQINPNDLISKPSAGELAGITRQAIDYLIEQGIIKAYRIAGRELILKQDAIQYGLTRTQRREK